MKPAKNKFSAKKGFIAGLPFWMKALFVKFWFAGAVFYYIGWGSFINTADQLDLTIALGLTLGLVTELLVNRLLVYLKPGNPESHPYLLCYSKKFYSMPVNLILCMLISLLIAYTYHFINVSYNSVNGVSQGNMVLGAGPIVYGLLFVMYDGIFLSIKHCVKKCFNRRKDEQVNEIS